MHKKVRACQCFHYFRISATLSVAPAHFLDKIFSRHKVMRIVTPRRHQWYNGRGLIRSIVASDSGEDAKVKDTRNVQRSRLSRSLEQASSIGVCAFTFMWSPKLHFSPRSGWCPQATSTPIRRLVRKAKENCKVRQVQSITYIVLSLADDDDDQHKTNLKVC